MQALSFKADNTAPTLLGPAKTRKGATDMLLLDPVIQSFVFLLYVGVN